MVENVSGAIKVEIGVLREIQDRRLVGGGGVFEAQGVVGAQTVNRLDREIARIALLHVAAGVGQFQVGRVTTEVGVGLPQHFVEALGAAVQVACLAHGL